MKEYSKNDLTKLLLDSRKVSTFRLTFQEQMYLNKYSGNLLVTLSDMHANPRVITGYESFIDRTADKGINDSVGDMNILGAILPINRVDLENRTISVYASTKRVGKKAYNPVWLLECKYCGSSFTSTEIRHTGNYSCPICSEKRRIEAKRDARKKQQEKNKKRVEMTKRMLDGKYDDFIQNYKLDFMKLKASKTLVPKIDNFINNNADYTLGAVEKVGSRYIFHMICTICGTPITLSQRDLQKKIKCSCCGGVPTSVKGTYKKSHVGEVHNQLRIIAQSDTNFGCSVECVFCGKRVNTDLYSVLHNKLSCKCTKLQRTISLLQSDFCMSCENAKYNRDSQRYECTKGISATPFTVFGSATSDCPSQTINVHKEVYDEIRSIDKKDSFRGILKLADLKISNEGNTKKSRLLEVPNTSLLKEEEPYYIGRDGLAYYRCYCYDCNKLVILNDTQMATYNHEQCESIATDIVKYKRLDYKGLKL